MTSRDERTLIVDFAFRNENNLKIALKVGSAFNEIRRRIITNFLKDLEIALKLDNEWEIMNNFNKSKLNDCTFFIAKKVWGKKYQIGIHGKSGATDFIFGICKNPNIAEHLGSEKLKELDIRYGPGRISEWWAWYKSVDEPYRNWDNEEVLMNMFEKEQRDIVVSRFRDYIWGIKEIALEAIDEAVKSK